MATKVNTRKAKPVDKSDQEIIAELKEKLAAMEKDGETKCASAKEQLVNMLDVTVDKYRTATGAAEALRILRFTFGSEAMDLIPIAVKLSKDMAVETSRMKEKAEGLSYKEMDQLCDGFYEKEFDSDSAYKLAFEMMRIDLCRNVGGAADDMVGFIKRVQEEIDETTAKLDELEKQD